MSQSATTSTEAVEQAPAAYSPDDLIESAGLVYVNTLMNTGTFVA